MYSLQETLKTMRNIPFSHNKGAMTPKQRTRKAQHDGKGWEKEFSISLTLALR
jgi:hypothetical protein